jgi:predicted peptidase
MSLGGSGTWYLAAKYPDIFAAIAPMSGFTTHMDFIDSSIEKLANIPIWAFMANAHTICTIQYYEKN